MKDGTPPRQRRALLGAERWLEGLIFWSRWILAPAYVALCGCMAYLLWKVWEEFLQLIIARERFAETKAIAQVLVVVDLILVMNLVLMVTLVGYVNFVSRIDPSRKEDWPIWMGHLDYSGLKVQLLGSIIAVSAIGVLRLVVELADTDQPFPVDDQRLLWLVVFHGLFLLSVLTIAIVNRLKVPSLEADDRFRSV
jgi:uncharacterized protein (TIGR00645 family)